MTSKLIQVATGAALALGLCACTHYDQGNQRVLQQPAPGYTNNPAYSVQPNGAQLPATSPERSPGRESGAGEEVQPVRGQTNPPPADTTTPSSRQKPEDRRAPNPDPNVLDRDNGQGANAPGTIGTPQNTPPREDENKNATPQSTSPTP